METKDPNDLRPLEAEERRLLQPEIEDRYVKEVHNNQTARLNAVTAWNVETHRLNKWVREQREEIRQERERLDRREAEVNQRFQEGSEKANSDLDAGMLQLVNSLEETTQWMKDSLANLKREGPLGRTSHAGEEAHGSQVDDRNEEERKGATEYGKVVTRLRSVTHKKYGDRGYWHESKWCEEVHRKSVEIGFGEQDGEGRFMWISPRNEDGKHIYTSAVNGSVTGISEYDSRLGLTEWFAQFGELAVADFPFERYEFPCPE